MAWKNYIAFGAGEISPEIYERGNLDKFRTGLAKLRNCTVTKMGGLRGRAGTVKLFNTFDNQQAQYYSSSEYNKLFEFTAGHLRVYEQYESVAETFTNIFDYDVDTTNFPIFTNIENMHFTSDDKYIYVFAEGSPAIRVEMDVYYIDDLQTLLAPTKFGWTPTAHTFTVTPSGSPSGPAQQYTYTIVLNGVESMNYVVNAGALPTSGSQKQGLTLAIRRSSFPGTTQWPEQVKFYRRPNGNGAFGYIGSSAISTTDATYIYYMFDDLGGAADFSDRPPLFQDDFITDVGTYFDKDPNFFRSVYTIEFEPKTGLIFQGRLVVAGTRTKNLSLASRTNATFFTRDFPLQDDSAIAFKSGSSGGAFIKKYFDARGLLIFTNVGVFETPEVLTPSTAYAVKRSAYVVDDKVDPIMIGDYVFFYDKRIKGLLGMKANDAGGWNTSEISIFSAHLFKNRQVIDWYVQNEDTQILWIVFDDGKLVSFSFQDEQQLRSFAQHDTDGFVERITGLVLAEDGSSRVFVQVIRNGLRYLERFADNDLDRVPIMKYVGFDSTVIFNNDITAILPDFGFPPTAISMEPSVVGDWTQIKVISPAGPFLNTAGNGAVGSLFRFFRDDGAWIDLEVTAFTNTTTIVLKPVDYDQPVSAFLGISSGTTSIVPSNFYKTQNVFTGLTHLEGKKVGVRVDGFTHASPLNTVDGYQEYTVTGGQITLVEGLRGAYVTIGLPYAQDIVTLEVDTAEQAPTKEQSMICNSMYLSYYESREFFTAARLPDDDTVTGMYKDSYQIEPAAGIIPMTPALITDRREVQTEGDWKSKGSVALRNVDPQPTGLRAILLDLEVRRK